MKIVDLSFWFLFDPWRLRIRFWRNYTQSELIRICSAYILNNIFFKESPAGTRSAKTSLGIFRHVGILRHNEYGQLWTHQPATSHGEYSLWRFTGTSNGAAIHILDIILLELELKSSGKDYTDLTQIVEVQK